MDPRSRRACNLGPSNAPHKRRAPDSYLFSDARSVARVGLLGDKQEHVAGTASQVNLDALLAQHVDHFCDMRRPGWNLAIQRGERQNGLASLSGDFQKLTAARAEAKSVNGSARNVYQCTCHARSGLTRTCEHHLALGDEEQ